MSWFAQALVTFAIAVPIRSRNPSALAKSLVDEGDVGFAFAVSPNLGTMRLRLKCSVFSLLDIGP
jgi:hypothetical protein